MLPPPFRYCKIYKRLVELNERPAIPAEVPAPLRDIIASGLLKDPDDRLTFAEVTQLLKGHQAALDQI